MTQALNLANFANNLNTSGATTNAGLQNPSLTVTAGTGMSGGGSVALGSSVTLTNAGVTSVTGAGTVSVSASTGSVTITGTGGSGTVTSVATGNGLTGGTITSTGTLSLDYYTGTDRNLSSYPIGSYIAVGYGGGGERNSTSTIYGYTAGITDSFSAFGRLAVGTRFTLSGTWRARGGITLGCCGWANTLAQRTA